MRRSAAPFVVFGGILAIGITTVTIVAIGHCRRDEPYLDPVILEYRRRPAPRRSARPPAPELIGARGDAAAEPARTDGGVPPGGALPGAKVEGGRRPR